MSRLKVSVLVAGSWGTALASVLANNGHEVIVWSRNKEQVDEINRFHTNEKYLPGTSLPPTLRASTEIEETIRGTAMIVVAAPSSAVGDVVKRSLPYLEQHMVIVHAAKGFEMDSGKRMSEVIEAILPESWHDKIAVLSGPSHAEEVVQQCPTTVVVASKNKQSAELVQSLFMSPYFRVYTNPDVIGVEIGGALKNIIAICSGLSDGLGFGDNAKAALVTRGLAEMRRLGIRMGADPLTFAGLSGVGDLIVTCNSKHSRNWRAGYMLAQGKSLSEVMTSMGMVVEGIKTTQSAYALAKLHGVEMPITTQLYQVLFQNKEPREAVIDLMSRDKTQEIEEIDPYLSTHWT